MKELEETGAPFLGTGHNTTHNEVSHIFFLSVNGYQLKCDCAIFDKLEQMKFGYNFAFLAIGIVTREQRKE